MKDTINKALSQNNDLSKIELSYSLGSIKNPQHDNKTINISQLAEIFKNSKKELEQVRNITTLFINNPHNNQYKNQLRTAKSRLSFSIIGGTAKTGHKAIDIEPNGLVQIDIDIKVKGGDILAKTVKETLTKHPNFILLAISPSGYGVKGIICLTEKIKEQAEYNKAIYQINESLKAYLKTKLNSPDFKKLSFDTITYNVPCYNTSDNNTFINRNAKKFEYKPIIKQVLAKAIHKSTRNPTSSSLSIELQRRAAKIALFTNQSTESRTKFIQSFVGMSVNFGVGLDIAKETLNNCDYVFEPTHYHKLEQMYNSYSNQFGSNEYSLFNKIDLGSNFQILKKGKKLLGSIKYDIYKSGSLVAPTASGKSFFAMNCTSDKKIIVVPTQILVEEFEQGYGATPFYEGANDLTNDQTIVVTYSSFGRLCNTIDISEYITIIDESQNFTSSTNQNFQLNELREVINKAQHSRASHLFTATPLLNVHPFIKSLPITVIKEETPAKRFFEYTYYSKDRLKAIVNWCKENKKEGVQSFVLFNNKSNHLSDLKKLLEIEKIKFAALNSTTKKELEHKKIVLEGDANEFDLVIATTVLKEGTSITKHNKKCKFLIVGSFHPSDIEQFSARPRKLKQRNVSILVNKNKEWSEGNTYGSNRYKELLRAAKFDQIIVDNIIREHKGINYENDMKINRTLESSAVYINDNGIATICPLHISNQLYLDEKQAANCDKEYMNLYLSQYGWKLVSDSFISGDLSEKEKQKRRAANKSKKELAAEIRKELYNGVCGLEGLKNENEKFFESQIIALESDLKKKGEEADTYHIKMELRERRRIMYVWNLGFFGDFKQAIESIEKTGGKEANYKELKTTILIQQAKIHGGDTIKRKIKDYTKAFEVGKTYTIFEAWQIVNNVKGKYNQTPITNRAIVKFLGRFFEVERGRNKGEKLIKIISNEPIKKATEKTAFQNTVTNQDLYENLPF